MVNFDSPLMGVAVHGDSSQLRMVLTANEDARPYVDRIDRKMGDTPLIALGYREDTDDIVSMALLLLANGAHVDTPNRDPGITAIWVAAQEGKPKLLSCLIDNGANIEIPPVGSITLPIWAAAQVGNYECVAKLALAGAAQGKSILDTTNYVGRTVCYIAVMNGHAEAVGALARAGADLRRASPIYYNTDDTNFDPSPLFTVHWPLDKAVRSFTTYTCAECGELGETLLKCSRCALAFFCNRDCQTKGWASHKKCCGKLAAGAKLYGEGPVPDPPTQPYGFVDEFTPEDHEIMDPEVMFPERHPVWEYDGGSRGHAKWERYPPYIEGFLEEMLVSGCPRLMYKPGDHDHECTGIYESDVSAAIAPRQVATRFVTYTDMVEREVYTGASRSVRRNGKRSCR